MRCGRSNQAESAGRSNRGRRRWVLPAITALVFSIGGLGTARADIPQPPQPDDDDDDVTGTCLPEKEVGDECRLPNGDDGVCIDETQACGFDQGQTVYCQVCDEDGCSIAGVGMSAPTRAGWIAFGALAALGLYRRRRPRR